MNYVIKRFSLIFLLCVLISLLSGCSQATQIPATKLPFRVVQRVEITFQKGSINSQRSYVQEDKIQKVLDYLVLIDPYGTPEINPEAIGNSEFQLRLIYTDGSEKLYRQREHRYMKIQNGSWKLIDPEKAKYLSQIVSEFPSDG